MSTAWYRELHTTLKNCREQKFPSAERRSRIITTRGRRKRNKMKNKRENRHKVSLWPIGHRPWVAPLLPSPSSTVRRTHHYRRNSTRVCFLVTFFSLPFFLPPSDYPSLSRISRYVYDRESTVSLAVVPPRGQTKTIVINGENKAIHVRGEMKNVLPKQEI